MIDVGVSVAGAHTDAGSERADLMGVLVTEGPREDEQTAGGTTVAEVERASVDPNDVQSYRRPRVRADVARTGQDRVDLLRRVRLDRERVARMQVEPSRETFADRDLVGRGRVRRRGRR